MLLSGLRRRQAVADLIRFAVVILITLLGVEVAGGLVFATVPDVDHRVVSLTLSVVGGLVLAAAGAVLNRSRGQSAAALGWCVTSWPGTILYSIAAAVAGYAALLITFVAAGLLQPWFPSALSSLLGNAKNVTEVLPPLGPAILGATVCLVGFYEELICRGFLLPRLRRATGSAFLAVAVSSLIFALPHAHSQNWITVVPLFLVACAWAVITLRQRSVVPAIIGHALFDLVQVIGLYYSTGGWS